MSWSRAFGGIVRRPTSVSETDGEEVLVPPHEASYPANPDGVGFYLGEEEAENQPLPALEWADAPIRTWNDYPEPACFAPYPLYGGLRGEFVIRGGKVDRSRLGRLTSRATPRLSFDTLAPGAPVELWGMRPARESLRFAIPRSPGVAVVDVGQDGSSIPLVLDAVDIDAEASSVRFVFRAMLSYALVQHERRVIRLVPTDALPPEPGRRLP